MKKKINGKEYKIQDSLYFQAKELDLAKKRFCQEVKIILRPILQFLERILG
jgi:hypothetical protein